jgi:capsular polysaccharide biosynthesis protein
MHNAAPILTKPDPITPGEAPQGEHDLPLKELLRAIRQHVYLIMLLMIVCVGFSLGYSQMQTPTYLASSKVLVGLSIGQGYGKESTPADLVSGVQGLQQFSKTAAELGSSGPMVDAIARRLDLDGTPADLQGNMSVEQIGSTPALEIKYQDTSPERAAEVVNASAEVLSEEIPGMSPGGNVVTASVWEKAEVPQVRNSPNKKNYALGGLALGGLLGIGLALLLERLDNRCRSLEEVEQISGYPTLCAIPEFSAPKVSFSNKRKGEE